MDSKKVKPKDEAFKKIESYRRTDVFTSNREAILLMMYGGAIRFIKRAIEASEIGDNDERIKCTQKTQEIVSELRSTLNFQIGGEIANNLDQLYDFVIHRLIQANLEKNVNYLKDALNILTTLNSAWEEAIESLRKERTNAER